MERADFEPNWFFVFLLTLAGIFIGALGFYIWVFNGNEPLGLQKIHPTNATSTYRFINPLFAVDTIEKRQFLEDTVIETKINNIIQRAQRSGRVTSAAAYFRDFESGRWFSVNGDLQFSPGKVLKIPIMIAHFLKAQNNPGHLEQSLTYAIDPVLTENATSSLVPGRAYTVQELIEAMLNRKDGNATGVLFDNLDPDSLREIYTDLGIGFPEEKLADDFISIKQFALFFRVLYNATYLNRVYSEQALEILSHGDRGGGFSRNLPGGIVIAHRQRIRPFSHGNKQFTESHDCGIVYYPNHPYLLCLMGIGAEASSLNDLFDQISRVSYAEMATRYRGR